MKVICISTSIMPNSNNNPLALSKIKEGNIYTVIKVTSCGRGYNFKEVQHPLEPMGAWNINRFIPLSAIDEMELLEQRQTELA